MSNIYKEGKDRKEELHLPPSIDEYVSEDNQVRAIEDYVELLDMVELDFTKSPLKSTDGQPAYHPKLLLKIYIYGYLNRIRSFAIGVGENFFPTPIAKSLELLIFGTLIFSFNFF